MAAGRRPIRTMRAWALLLAWPVGIPLGLLALLWRQWRKNVRGFQATDPAADGGEGASDSVHEYHKGRIQARYGFCVDDYRAECWWMEPVDMLRKLALSGLLQFVERGTAAQVLLGCCLAFGSFGLQVRLLPYRERSANVLKTAAELVLFLTFLISFILRVLPRIEAYEPLTADTYGWVLVAAFGSFVALAVGLTAKQNWERRRFRSGLADFASGTQAANAAGNPQGTDMNCDGVVDGVDFTVPYFLTQFASRTPGASGLVCAGTVPCL